MEMFCKHLRDQAIKIVDYGKKEMIPLTDEEIEFYEKQKLCQICEKEFSNDKNDKVRDHRHYTGKFRRAAQNICNLRYKISKEIPVFSTN